MFPAQIFMRIESLGLVKPKPRTKHGGQTKKNPGDSKEQTYPRYMHAIKGFVTCLSPSLSPFLFSPNKHITISRTSEFFHPKPVQIWQ